MSLILQNSLSGPKSREVNVKSARFQELFFGGSLEEFLEVGHVARKWDIVYRCIQYIVYIVYIYIVYTYIVYIESIYIYTTNIYL